MDYNFLLREQNINARNFDKKYPELEDVAIHLKYWDRYSSKYQCLKYGKQHIEILSYVKCPRENCTGKIWVETPINNATKNKKKILDPYTVDCRNPIVENNKVIGKCDIDHHEVTIELIFK